MGGQHSSWTRTRTIIHFVGICGSGKTTLSKRLADRCRFLGGKALITLDWDPSIGDSECTSERAFSRETDQSSAVDKYAIALQHSLDLISNWSKSDLNLILVDRWYESYDDFPPEFAEQIENALLNSGFKVLIVNLVLTPQSAECSVLDVIRSRLSHTRAERPEEWWTSEMGTLEEMVHSESTYQDSYSKFSDESRFECIQISTTDMDWVRAEQLIFNSF